MTGDRVTVSSKRVTDFIFSFDQNNGRLVLLDKSIRKPKYKMWTCNKMRRLSIDEGETALQSPRTLSCNVRWVSRPEKSLHFLFSSSHTWETLKSESILLTRCPFQPGKGGVSLFLRSYVKSETERFFFLYSDLYFALEMCTRKQ